LWLQTSNCSLLLIYRPRKDERLSWPGRLTYSGRFTHIIDHPSDEVERRTGKVRRSKTSVLPLCHATNNCQSEVTYDVISVLIFRLFVVSRRIRSRLFQERVSVTVSRPTDQRRGLPSRRRSAARDAATLIGGQPATASTTTRRRCVADCATPSRRASDWRPLSTPSVGIWPPKTSVRRRLLTTPFTPLSCWPTSTRYSVCYVRSFFRMLH